MAKKNGDPNRSQAIREFLEASPTSSAKEVVAALDANGITVKESLVYAVKGSMKERRQRKARVVKAAKAASATGTASKTDAITMVREVKALALKAGGYEKLKELVDALAE
jgi:arginine repressor